MGGLIMSVILNATTSTGLTMTPDNSGAIQFQSNGTNTIAITTGGAINASTQSLQTGGTTALYIDGSQNVGIGTTSPSTKFTVQTAALTDAVRWTDNTNSTGILSTASGLSTMWSTTALGFGTGAGTYTERMRIDSSGNLLVGVTSDPANSGNNGVSFYKTTNGYEFHSRGNGTGTNYVGVFYNNNGTVGNINTNGTTTSYVTSSDYRLKENVTPMTNGLSTINSLKPVTYDWISDKSSGEGFIAHELQAVIPNAVTGEKDAVNEDGSINPQGVDYSKIVVHLVAALQELKATVDAQATEIATLKAKVGA
jgi:hypothetical protein